jgi:hypothetical protein
VPQFFPNVATVWLAELVQTELALSKLRLWQDGEIIPSIATTRAALVAAEADYTGYTATGETLTAWFAPLNNPVGGSSIDSPKEQFAAASPFTVANVIGGFWVETAGADLVVIGVFETPVPVGAAGQGFPLSVSLIFPN